MSSSVHHHQKCPTVPKLQVFTLKNKMVLVETEKT